MRVQVDSTKCEAYGICEERAPGLFTLDDFGYASELGDGAVPSEQEGAAQAAVADCPVSAIRNL